MAATVTKSVQVNVRVSPTVRRGAEEQLERVGSSVGELVRAALEKVARSPQDCAEVQEVLADKEPGPVGLVQTLAEGWEAADAFLLAHGTGASQAADTRSWDDMYREAMDERYAQKGLFA